VGKVENAEVLKILVKNLMTRNDLEDVGAE
jgi:hypothetical protein